MTFSSTSHPSPTGGSLEPTETVLQVPAVSAARDFVLCAQPGSDRKTDTIMIVDDEEISIKIVRKYLCDVGYENFVTVSDATLALQTIREQQPDILLLDIMMPEIDGLEILAQVRADTDLRHLPVVILTAASDAATRRVALDLGATDLLTKPVDASELLLRVRNVLLVKSHQDHLARYAEQLENEVRQRSAELLASRHEATYRYLTGKAEIAAEVLHNVGNALTSIIVSVGVLRNAVNRSRVRSVGRTAQLLAEHSADLPHFVEHDERGQLLPKYLDQLARHLSREQCECLEEIDSLAKHVDYVQAVVASQQKYAGMSGMREPVSLAEVLDDAVELSRGTFDKNGIPVEREYDDVPEIVVEKHKLLQIFVNVLRNAEQAILESGRKDGRITLRLRCKDRDFVAIDIVDNGVGIDPLHLLKMFSYGFTTKTQGRGYGLHNCAKLAGELGGALAGDSPGLGKGATFTLELPFKLSEVMK